MHVLVTGGAGFIGANLVRHLAAEVAHVEHVTVLDDLSTGSRTNLDGLPAAFVEGSVCDAGLLAEVCDGVDAVVHLAARPSVPRSIAEPLATHEANSTGTLRVLEAARAARVGHVVVASSSSVYGANPTLPKHEDLPTEPLSPYAVSKLAAEQYTSVWQRVYGLPTIAFRFFNVFGPLQPAGHAYAAVIPMFVEAALAGRSLPVHGDGLQSRDFTYVGSVVRVLAAAVVQRVAAEGPVNLAFGSRRTLLEAITVLEQVLGHPVEVAHVDPRPGDVRHSQADQARFRSLFPDIEPVGFEDGLRHTVDWFRGLG
jgi:UDP-glucose 4-epimerase